MKRTGWRNNRVVHYNTNGFVADLPDLKIGRMDHACSYYYSWGGIQNTRRVSILALFRVEPSTNFKKSIKAINLRQKLIDLSCNGGTTRQNGGMAYDSDSTEVLIEGSKGWTLITGSLPSARKGLRMVRTNDDNKRNSWLIATG